MKGAAPKKVDALTKSARLQVPWTFTADGTRLAYYELSPATGFDLWTVPITAARNTLTAGEPMPFLQTPAYETYASFSPDGRWMAYGSGQYGLWEVYVRPFPDTGAQPVRISEGGGRIARWVPGRQELLYRTDDHRIMAVSYEIKDNAFVPGKVRPWTSVRLADTGVISNFDLHPDGRRIAALLPAATAEVERNRNRVTVVLNFADDIRRRVSHGGS
jgi:serine/threonine-protein kinase